MSQSDSDQPERRKADPDISFLPEVVAVESALRTYRKPRYRALGSEVVPVERAVEITISTAAPFPERALGPVVLIGSAQVTESERIGPNRYRFYAYDFEKLKEGAPIRIGWFGQPRPRRTTGFRFALQNNGGRRPSGG
jgi:hypothetical protein